MRPFWAAITAAHQHIERMSAIVSDKVCKAIYSPWTIVKHRWLLRPSREEFERRKASNVPWHIIGFRIYLRNRDSFAAGRTRGVKTGKLLVDGSHGLARPTPLRVVINQNVPVVVEDNLIPAVTDNDGDWSLLYVWHRLWFDDWLEVAVEEVIDERADDLFWKLLPLIEGVAMPLGNVFDCEGWPLVWLEVQFFC